MTKCDSCRATVDGEMTMCPDCGYSPRKTLLRNGVVYAVLTASILFVVTPLVVNVFGAPIVPTMFAAIVLCILTGYYGLYLILAGESATVVEPLDEYVGLVID